MLKRAQYKPRPQQDNPSVQPEIDDWNGPQFSESESSDRESDNSDKSQDEVSDSEESEFQSADNQTPEVPVRTSSRTNKGIPPTRLQMEDWRKDQILDVHFTITTHHNLFYTARITTFANISKQLQK